MIFIALNCTFAFACKCAIPESDEEAIKDSDIAFIGTVEELKEEDSTKETLTAVFKVDKWHKGSNEPLVEIKAYTSGNRCAVRLDVGSKYKIFYSFSHPLTFCTRSAKIT